MNKFLASATVFAVLIVLSASNRGFDLSDEGLYALLAEPNQENKAGIFNYDLFFKAFYQFTGYTFSLPQLRIFRILTYLAAAWALAGFWKNIADEDKLKADIFWISCLGLFTGFAFLPPTLSYNSLTVVLTCFGIFQLTKKNKSHCNFIALGLILAVLVYVKVTLALLFFPLTLVFLFFGEKLRPLQALLLILPLLVLELGFHFLLNENAFSRLQEGIPLNIQRSGYEVSLMVKSMGVGAFWIGIVLLIFFAIGYFKIKRNALFVASQIIAGFSVPLICYLTHITDEWNHLFLLGLAAFLGYQLGIGVFKPTQTNLWILFLLILPFLLHLGSNVYWLRIGVQYLVFWFLGFAWIFRNLNRQVKLAIPVISIFLVFNGIWWHPFAHEKPLWTPKEKWKIGEGQTLLLDPDLIEITEKLKGFQGQHSQTQIAAAYRIPGLLWLTGSTLPFSPGIWDISQLNGLFEAKPKVMIYNKLQPLPHDWQFRQTQDLAVFRSDSLQILWD